MRRCSRFSCLGVAATASATRGAESINGIAAIVNGEVITYSQVRDMSIRANACFARSIPAKSW